jgi:hypothetical protein
MASEKDAKPLHAIPIAERPRKTWLQLCNAIGFTIIFNAGVLAIHSSQLLFLLPLKLIPFGLAAEQYDEGMRYTKGAFATLLGWSCDHLF